jgi:hypothetical protein
MNIITKILFTISILAVFYISAVFFYTTGAEDGKRSVYELAARHHYGVWRCDPNGVAHFHWSTIDE